MKIFVIHYDKLVERNEHIKQQLKNVPFEFVSNKGVETLTESDMKMFSRINKKEISLSLHHFECYRKLIEQNEYDYALVLEDDVIIADNFFERIQEYINELPNNWDLFFIGNAYGIIPPHILQPNKHVYRKYTRMKNKKIIDGATRCADSYLISKACAEKIIRAIDTPGYWISLPVDHQLNYIIYYEKLQVYWAEPTLVQQGSQLGLFPSSH